MKQAFRISDEEEVTDCGKVTIPEQAFKGLKVLLKDMDSANPNPSSGGEILLIEQDTGKMWRLTFCDFTGLTICPFCHGTGAKPKNTN